MVCFPPICFGKKDTRQNQNRRRCAAIQRSSCGDPLPSAPRPRRPLSAVKRQRKGRAAARRCPSPQLGAGRHKSGQHRQTPCCRAQADALLVSVMLPILPSGEKTGGSAPMGEDPRIARYFDQLCPPVFPPLLRWFCPLALNSLSPQAQICNPFFKKFSASSRHLTRQRPNCICAAFLIKSLASVKIPAIIEG